MLKVYLFPVSWWSSYTLRSADNPSTNPNPNPNDGWAMVPKNLFILNLLVYLLIYCQTGNTNAVLSIYHYLCGKFIILFTLLKQDIQLKLYSIHDFLFL